MSSSEDTVLTILSFPPSTTQVPTIGDGMKFQAEAFLRDAPRVQGVYCCWLFQVGAPYYIQTLIVSGRKGVSSIASSIAFLAALALAASFAKQRRRGTFLTLEMRFMSPGLQQPAVKLAASTAGSLHTDCALHASLNLTSHQAQAAHVSTTTSAHHGSNSKQIATQTI